MVKVFTIERSISAPPTSALLCCIPLTLATFTEFLSIKGYNIAKVSNYIANQHEHHGKKTFQDEKREMLEKYAIEYDERYVWD